MYVLFVVFSLSGNILNGSVYLLSFSNVHPQSSQQNQCSLYGKHFFFMWAEKKTHTTHPSTIFDEKDTDNKASGIFCNIFLINNFLAYNSLLKLYTYFIVCEKMNIKLLSRPYLAMKDPSDCWLHIVHNVLWKKGISPWFCLFICSFAYSLCCFSFFFTALSCYLPCKLSVSTLRVYRL